MTATNNSINSSGAQYQNPRSTATYTLKPSDAGGTVIFSNAATVLIDKNVNQPIPVGCYITLVVADGVSGLVDITTNILVTLLRGTNPSIAQDGTIVLYQESVDVWIVMSVCDETSIVTAFTWGGFTTPNQTIKLTRIGRNFTIAFPPMGNFVSTQTAYLVSTVAVPARFRPSGNTSGGGFVSLDNGTTQVSARFAIDNTGALYITSATGGNFSATTQIKTEGYSLLFSN